MALHCSFVMVDSASSVGVAFFSVVSRGVGLVDALAPAIFYRGLPDEAQNARTSDTDCKVFFVATSTWSWQDLRQATVVSSIIVASVPRRTNKLHVFYMF